MIPNVFRQLFTYDENENSGVSHVASALQITEYEVFQIAYIQWFGQTLSTPSLDKYFAIYVKNDVVPFWVNDFVRKASEKFEAGTLDRSDYNIKPRSSSLHNKIIGWIIIILLAILMALYCYIIPRTISF